MKVNGAVREIISAGIDITQHKLDADALRRSEDQLWRLTANLLTAQEEERKRVARELHDDLNQRMALLANEVSTLAQTPPGSARLLRKQLPASSGPVDTELEAADGVEALEVADQQPGPIHLLLTDWCMPRLDGGGLIRGLTNGRPETAILVMSGYMSLEPPRKAVVLHKPFRSQDLMDSVNGVLYGQCLSPEARSATSGNS